MEVLKSLDHYFATHENPHEIEVCLDEAFNISLKYQGKAKAYVWLGHEMSLAWSIELKVWQRPSEYGELEIKKRTAFFRDEG